MKLHQILVVASTVLALSACGQYVKRDEFDAAMSDLRASDARNAEQIESLRVRFSELTDDLENRFAGYNARITELAGRLRIDMTTRFAYDDASLDERDQQVLQEFADVIRQHPSRVMVTVEGFTDPAGSAEYNQWLGQQRANAARQYLIAHGGLSADLVRAVSYGEDANRQVAPGQWGANGEANRRVALVIDHVSG